MSTTTNGSTTRATVRCRPTSNSTTAAGRRVAGAWVTATDPAFAPQILNVVSLWDDIYDTWVRHLNLAPALYDETKGGFRPEYKPTFDDQIRPIFSSAALQQWVVNLNQRAMSADAALATISAADDPATTPLAGIKAICRSPYDPTQQDNITLMPAHLGDAGESFLTLRKTQYFFLERWNAGKGNYLAGRWLRYRGGEKCSTRRPSSTASAAASAPAST